MKEIKVKLTFTEEILGTAPSDPEIYKKYIASKVSVKFASPSYENSERV